MKDYILGLIFLTPPIYYWVAGLVVANILIIVGVVSLGI